MENQDTKEISCRDFKYLLFYLPCLKLLKFTKWFPLVIYHIYNVLHSSTVKMLYTRNLNVICHFCIMLCLSFLNV